MSVFFLAKNQKGSDTTPPLEQERSPPQPPREQHRKQLTIQLSERKEVKIYGIKTRYPKHGKDIRNIGIRWGGQDRTAEN